MRKVTVQESIRLTFDRYSSKRSTMNNSLVIVFLIAISQVLGQSYLVLEAYDTSTCKGSSVAVVASLTDSCFGVENDLGGIDYYIDRCNDTAATSEMYSDSLCSGIPSETEPFTIGACAAQNIDKLGEVSAISSCATDIPVYTGNIITASYYLSSDCSGTLFRKVSFDYTWIDCLGGIKLQCTDKLEVEAYFCSATDCSGTCSSFGALPSGTCIPDDTVTGTSFTFECTSGSSSLIASVALVLASIVLVLF